jgi:hypothetical protein
LPAELSPAQPAPGEPSEPAPAELAPPPELLEPLPCPEPSLRLLPASLVDPEPFWKRRLFEIVALGITLCFFYFITSYWAPAHPGVDQNGYLVGGKQLALTGSSGMKLAHPLEYVGSMWVITGDLSSDNVWYYPKYPIGLPLLYAIPLWINWEHGKDFAFYVSPAGAAMAVLGMFFLVRTVAGSFVGVMGMVLLGMNTVMLALANNPNSHASCTAFVVWGMFMLLRWWQTGAIWRGLLAGFLLGFAVTIRYTEGLLILPLGVAVLSVLPYRQILKVSWWRIAVCVALGAGATALRLYERDGHSIIRAVFAGLLALGILIPWWKKKAIFRHPLFYLGLVATALLVAAIAIGVPDAWQPVRDTDGSIKLAESYDVQAAVLLGLTFAFLTFTIYSPPSWRRGVTPILGWLIPVLWLLGFNWFAMHTITGYDSTNESSAFTEAGFQQKWEFMVSQLYQYGAFFLLPLTVLGLMLMWRWSARVALAAMLWLMPGVLLYTAYYWGNNNNGLGYLRFFLTLVPAMILPAVWFLRHGAYWRADSGEITPRRGSIGMPIACGVYVSLIALMAIRNALPLLERDVSINNNLAYTGQQIASTIPPGSVVLAESRGGRGGGGYSLLNYLQWKGDYQLFSADAFTGGGRGMRNIPQDPDQPRPLQRERVQYLREKVYPSIDDLEQNRLELIRSALLADPARRVFIVAPTNNNSSFLQALFSRQPGGLGAAFDTKRINFWKEPLALSPEIGTSPLMMGRGAQVNRPPMSWQIVEVKFRPGAATQPAEAQPAASPQPAQQPPRRGGRGRGRGNRANAAAMIAPNR